MVKKTSNRIITFHHIKLDCYNLYRYNLLKLLSNVSFPVAQLVEHGASNAMIMGSIPKESKS